MNNKLVIMAVILAVWVVASTYNTNPDDSNVPYLLREKIVELGELTPQPIIQYSDPIGP